jgi:hypothetical protein
VRVRNAFVAFAASYFFLVGLKNGTVPKLANDINRGAQDLFKGGKTLTRIG